MVHYEDVDDYGTVGRNFEGVDPSRFALARQEAAKDLVGNAGFDVHRDTVGDSARMIGAVLSGPPPHPNEDRRGLATFAAEEMVKPDTIEPAVVERCCSILSWVFLICRGTLSEFNAVYGWCLENRGIGQMRSSMEAN